MIRSILAILIALSGCVEPDAATPPLASDEVGVLLIGDSLTAQDHYPSRVYDVLRASSHRYRMIGSLHVRWNERARHEGRGGWTFGRYLEDPASPFVDGAASGWVRQYGRPAIVVIALGTNDVFNARAEQGVLYNDRLNTSIDNAEALAGMWVDAGVLAVGIAPPPPPNPYPEAYSSTGTTPEAWAATHRDYVERLSERFAYWPRVHIIPAWAAFDPRAGFDPDNAAHPNPLGYHRYADTIAAWILESTP